VRSLTLIVGNRLRRELAGRGNSDRVVPPPHNLLTNPDHWRKRAEECRTIADTIRYDDVSKQRLLRIAAEYDRMAEHAERQLAEKKQSGS